MFHYTILSTSRSKNNVFQCMRSVLDQCPAAEDVLSYWGHQQTSVENAVNVICANLPRMSYIPV